MRILYHHRTLGDGAEGVHISAMVEAFRTLGHDVRVCGPAAGGRSDAGRAGQVKALLPPAAFELASVVYNVPEYMAMRRLLAQWRPALLYKRHARYDVAALMAARHLGIPSILEVNAVYSARPFCDFEPQALQPVARRLERQACRSATLVAAVSSPMAAQVEQLSGRHAEVVPNGADPTLFDAERVAPRPGPWSAGSGLLLGWTGILREWHGLELLLDGAALAGARVLLIGDGPARPAVERRAQALGLGGRLFITGRVPRADIPAYLQACDLGVVADERTGVASPMKLLEYMSMAKAVVAPDLPNIRDLVIDGTHGRLFQSGSAEALAAAVSALAEPDLRRKLGLAGRGLVLQERNWLAIATRLLTGPAVGRAWDTAPSEARHKRPLR